MLHTDSTDRFPRAEPSHEKLDRRMAWQEGAGGWRDEDPIPDLVHKDRQSNVRDRQSRTIRYHCRRIELSVTHGSVLSRLI
jgi:hypothetical protein